MVKLNFSYTSYFKVAWFNQTTSSVIYSKNIAYFLSFLYILVGMKQSKIKIMAKPRRKKLLSLVITPQTSKRKAFQFTKIKYKNSILISIPIKLLSIEGSLNFYLYLQKLSKIFLSILSFQTKCSFQSNIKLNYIK